jgi:recombinational DNA repair protein (RecF pathway)
MPTPEVVTTGVVLSRENRGESFIAYRLISPELGLLTGMLRRSRKPNSNVAIDLFDEGEFRIEQKPGALSGFVKDAKVFRRRAKLSRNYANFVVASNFATLIASNPIHEENASFLVELLSKSLDAWENSSQPYAIQLKCLYLYCRQEGYPIKEDWAQRLPEAERSIVVRTLNQPLRENTENEDALKRAILSLETYLQHHTHIRLANAET